MTAAHQAGHQAAEQAAEQAAGRARGQGAGRPVPVPDESSRPYWDSAARHVLSAARCSRCGALSLPPDQICTHCGSTDPQFGFVPVSGKGAVRSWTIVRRSFLPGFTADLPFLLVDVELADQPGLRLIGRLVDGPDAPVAIGTPVRAAFEDVAPGVAVPAFELAGEGERD